MTRRNCWEHLFTPIFSFLYERSAHPSLSSKQRSMIISIVEVTGAFACIHVRQRTCCFLGELFHRVLGRCYRLTLKLPRYDHQCSFLAAIKFLVHKTFWVISRKHPLADEFVNSHHLSAGQCIDVIRRSHANQVWELKGLMKLKQ